MITESENSVCIIIGEPGSGKSTLLRHYATFAYKNPKAIGLPIKHIPILIQLSDVINQNGSIYERIIKSISASLGYDFFKDASALTDNIEIPFIILLDSLDEVPVNKRKKLLNLLNTLIATNKSNKIIITSRPIAYTNGEVSTKNLKEYEILPFNITQILEFVKLWFPYEHEKFLNELNNICPIELYGTPLLLTIAAKVFSSQGSLPNTKACLYDKFIDIWLDEAVQKNLTQEFNIKYGNYLKFFLSEIAIYITSLDELYTEKSLIVRLKECFEKNLKLLTFEAEAEAQIFLNAMSIRSGVFTIRNNKYEFIHPTFREYLVAFNIVRQCNWNAENAFMQIKIKGMAGTWREIGLFVLCILSDYGINVNDILDLLLPFENIPELDSPEAGNLFFIVSSITNGVRVSQKLIDKIINMLLSIIQQLDKEDTYFLLESMGTRSPFKAICSIKDKKGIQKLYEIAEDRGNEYDGFTRYLCLESLISVGFNNKELLLLFNICLGNEPLYGSSQLDMDSRVDLIDGIIKKGYPLLAKKFLLILIKDLCDDGDIDIGEKEALVYKYINLDNNESLSDKEYQYLLRGDGKLSNSIVQTFKKIDCAVLNISIYDIIDKCFFKNERFCNNNDFKSFLSIVSKCRLNRSYLIKSLSDILFDSKYENWHRVSCYEGLVCFFKEKKDISALFCPFSKSYLDDSYALHYLRKLMQK